MSSDTEREEMRKNCLQGQCTCSCSQIITNTKQSEIPV